MQIARFDLGGQARWGVVRDETVSVVDSALESVMDSGLDGVLAVGTEPGGAEVSLADVELLSPVNRPSKLIGVGLNYRDHAEESGFAIPDSPVIFGILPSAIVGPHDPIELPTESTQVDWEAELGVVIGKVARNVSPGEALNYVLGYTIVHDVSARDLQITEGQWTRAKSFDSFKPVGPWITTADKLGDASGLAIRLWVNSELMQESNTSELIVGVPDLISFLSGTCTLLPGDLIMTGTPAGVGMAHQPPQFLREGDEVSIEIEGIGMLSNPVTRAAYIALDSEGT